MKKKIYVVATAHLDTTWLWTLRTTIEQYLPETFNYNFSLFEKFPEHKFSFEGSYRYELIEEYYPEAFKRIQEYAKSGRWCPAGSCYENGDVNVPSPEALTRNILYGTHYFRDKLGTQSNDIFLPDCFGFGAALPSVAAHSGLKGFTTGKLAWGSANGTPFDIGKWYGNDGNFLYATLKPGSYNRSITTLRNLPEFTNKLKDNTEKYGLPVTYTYHGTGDRGGAPAEVSVRNLCKEIRTNSVTDTDIVYASSSQLFDDLDALPEETKSRLPEWHGELLMTEHGAGSYTSRTVGKRWNRKNELLADAAERAAVTAGWLRGYKYPRKSFEKAWKRVIAHQFHDDITGTSIQECYKFNWNEYVQSLNVFSGEYSAAVDAIAACIDTSFCKGVPVIVNNPVQGDARTETVSAKIKWNNSEKSVKVFDRNSNEVYSQVVCTSDNEITVAFSATAPSIGFAVYDVRPSNSPCALSSSLVADERKAENSKIRIELNANGDICKLYDKVNSRETLASPVRLALLDDVHSKDWPSWEVKFKDISAPVREFAAHAKIELVENGPARAVYRITKTAGKSKFNQLVILDESSSFVRVFNEVDWRSTKSMLKAVFHLKASNPNATYDIGLGSISRPSNTEKQFEVPAQMWADITDESGKHGVSVFSDSRSGWDKPSSSILRLTCIHTPASSFRWECAQHLLDLGLNRFSFGLYPHADTVENGTQYYANCFNQPMNTFVTDVHAGTIKEDFSFAGISESGVWLRALKLAEKSDKIIVRFNEGDGKAKEGVRFSIGAGIEKAEELNGCEDYIGEATVENGELVFDIAANTLKTFALTLKPCGFAGESINQTALSALPFNACVITTNEKRNAATTAERISLPAEILPDTINFAGLDFPVCKAEKNAVQCNNQEIALPENCTKLHLLVLCTNESNLTLNFGSTEEKRLVPDSRKAIGAWDLVALGEMGYITKDQLAFTATHTHTPCCDKAAEQLYIFRYSFDIPEGAASFKLAPNSDMFILSGVATSEKHLFANANELYDSLEKREYDYEISAYDKRYASPLAIEKLVYKFLPMDRTRFMYSEKFSRALQLTDEFADRRRKYNGKR